MPDPETISTEVFRFIGLRRPRVSSVSETDVNTIWDPRPVNTTVAAEFGQLRTNLSKAIALAQERSKTQDFIAGFEQAPGLSKVRDKLLHASTAESIQELTSDISKILGCRPAEFVQGEKAKLLEKQLWDSLYIAAVAGSAVSANYSQIKNLIQTFAALHELNETRANEDDKRKTLTHIEFSFTREPVIPPDILPFPLKQHLDITLQHNHADTKTARLNTERSELEATFIALEEINAIIRKGHLEAAQPQTGDSMRSDLGHISPSPGFIKRLLSWRPWSSIPMRFGTAAAAPAGSKQPRPVELFHPPRPQPLTLAQASKDQSSNHAPNIRAFHLRHDALASISKSSQELIDRLAAKEQDAFIIYDALEARVRKIVDDIYSESGLEAIITMALMRRSPPHPTAQGEQPETAPQQGDPIYDTSEHSAGYGLKKGDSTPTEPSETTASEGTPDTDQSPNTPDSLKDQVRTGLCDLPIWLPVACVRPAGVGDLQLVRQMLLRYTAEEIAHIENVLKTESRGRTHRQLDRTELTLLTDRERTDERSRDLQTSERFELSHESQNEFQSRMSLEGALNVTARYGAVTTTADVNAAIGQEVTASDNHSSQYAKEVVDKAIERVQERIREQRTTTTIHEVEETNEHTIDATAAPDHIVGQYLWVNKQSLALVLGYGKRLMVEFIIPEPSVFYRHVNSPSEIKGLSVEKPVDPTGLPPSDVEWWNYDKLVAAYGATGVNPPPVRHVQRAKSFAHQAAEAGTGATASTESAAITAPDGYESLWAYTAVDTIGTWENTDIRLNVTVAAMQSYRALLRVIVGHIKLNDAVWWRPGQLMQGESDFPAITPLRAVLSTIPVTITALNQFAYGVEVIVDFEYTAGAYKKWQLETWEAIMQAYHKRKADYDNAVRAARVEQGISIRGNNPGLNREIEKTELQRACITSLTGLDLRGLDSIVDGVPPEGYPEIDVLFASRVGKVVQFFQQVIEWSQMTYTFYPYFWGRKDKWPSLIHSDDPDELFQRFLRAGSARVVVPVHPTYEQTFLYFLKTGYIWDAGSPPTVGDDDYLSYVDEFKSVYGLGESRIVGGPWEITLPTALVTLKPDLLPDFTVAATRELEKLKELSKRQSGAMGRYKDARLYGKRLAVSG